MTGPTTNSIQAKTEQEERVRIILTYLAAKRGLKDYTPCTKQELNIVIKEFWEARNAENICKEVSEPQISTPAY